MSTRTPSKATTPTSVRSSPLMTATTPNSLAKNVSSLSITTSGQRRLSTSSSTSVSSPTSASSSSSLSSPLSSPVANTKPAAVSTQTRRRLSVMSGNNDPKSIFKLDGAGDDVKEKDSKVSRSAEAPKSPMKKRRLFSAYASMSKVGYVPFNAGKVNQDRSAEVIKFGGSEEKAFFGVFDGHGTFGHDVSQFCATELPKSFLKYPNLDTEPHDAISKAFVDCHARLQKTHVDSSYSGTTAIVVYLNGGKIYSCNAGDSRAVLAKMTSDGRYEAVDLSSDHKPDRPDEKKRIIESRGRVEACKGMRGEDIGPPRVWLLHDDVPGLAMTRSIGDLIAASVGVSCKPEIFERDVHEDDRFFILASDGVWEFISSQEAVDMVSKARNAEEACRVLVEEATKRWHEEEEVVDDITCVIVYF